MDIILSFGKHKGEHIENVPASYPLWIRDNFSFIERDIKEYIKENENRLELIHEQELEYEDIISECGGDIEFWKD
jgi:hypothetical protein